MSKSEVANSVYEQIKLRLVDAEAAVAAVQRRLDEAQTDEERIKKVAASAPGVLVQAQDLDRDYSILKRNYQELVARREATAIANAADTKTEKIQFRIVDPPQVPILPAAPNRPMLVSMVLLFGIGGGLAVPLALTQIDRSFATIGQLRNLGLPILGSVSRLSLGAARRRAVHEEVGPVRQRELHLDDVGTALQHAGAHCEQRLLQRVTVGVGERLDQRGPGRRRVGEPVGGPPGGVDAGHRGRAVRHRPSGTDAGHHHDPCREEPTGAVGHAPGERKLVHWGPARLRGLGSSLVQVEADCGHGAAARLAGEQSDHDQGDDGEAEPEITHHRHVPRS